MKAAPRDPVEILLVDGRLKNPHEDALRADLPGVLRGEGIFESFLAVEGREPVFLRAHAERLEQSARLLGMDLGGRGLVEEWAVVAPHLQGRTLRVRYTVFRGLGDGLTRMWSAGRPAPAPREAVLQISRFRRDPCDPLAGAKTISRAALQAARREARQAGAWEALLPTLEGDFCECTSANLFLRLGRELRTPPLARGLLAGVTRAAILAGCGREGLQGREKPVHASDLVACDEIYITNAVIGVIPVRKILELRDDLPGQDGEFLPRLRAAYRAECRALRPANRNPHKD